MSDQLFYLGVCINNTSIMMFKKGSFETGGVIYPAAVKVVLLVVLLTEIKQFVSTA